MFNIILHALFVCIVFYYIYINGTDYDRPFYQTANQIHYFFYKKTKKARKDIRKYEKREHKAEDKAQFVKHRQTLCGKCDEKLNKKHRHRCRQKYNCNKYEKMDNFSNIEHLTNYNTNYDEDLDKNRKMFHNKTIFIEFKIIFLMFMCIIYASHQHYGVGGEFSFKNILKDFTGGIENLIYLVYIGVLLFFLYKELNKLYIKKKK
jgi:hypothetical protein